MWSSGLRAGFRRWRRLTLSSPWALITDERWVRRQLAQRGGTFTYRLGVAGQCWNPDQRGFNPIIGPAVVNYSLAEDGTVTAKVERLD